MAKERKHEVGARVAAEVRRHVADAKAAIRIRRVDVPRDRHVCDMSSRELFGFRAESRAVERGMKELQEEHVAVRSPIAWIELERPPVMVRGAFNLPAVGESDRTARMDVGAFGRELERARKVFVRYVEQPVFDVDVRHRDPQGRLVPQDAAKALVGGDGQIVATGARPRSDER
jgi:hypothetical protein